MRHGKKVNHLGRTDSHRKAMLGNMATSLILHKRITTTLAKAKALRVYVEPILTKAKSDTTHSRRIVFSYLQDKDAVTILFREIAEKIASRPGGYTRIIKMENRMGDNAEMALIELVDYNTVYGTDTGKAEKKSTRRRGGSKAKAAAPAAKTAPAVKEDVIEVAPVIETPEAVAPVVEEAVEEAPVVEEAVAEETPAAETETPQGPTASAEHEENAEKGE
jgi:large subunit ribosomal protein L17